MSAVKKLPTSAQEPVVRESPIRKMMAAMVVRAVHDMRSPNKYIVKHAYRWIFHLSKPEYPFSFANICRDLELKQSYIRKLAREAILASPYLTETNPHPPPNHQPLQIQSPQSHSHYSLNPQPYSQMTEKSPPETSPQHLVSEEEKEEGKDR